MSEQTHSSETPAPLVPIVHIREAGVRASSRDVAEFFGKNHKDVLRAIENLLSLEPSLCQRNFAPTSTAIPMPNGGSRSEPSFDMDRDGFTLLAMGFTGAKALKWKLRYIEAFNAMEAALREYRAADALDGHPSSADSLLWGVAVSKVNAAQRTVSTYAKLFGPEVARDLIRREPSLPQANGLLISDLVETAADDAFGCLTHLLRSAAEGGQPILGLFDLACTDAVAERRLRRFGLMARPEGMRGFFAVATAHPFLAQVFAETQWCGEWSMALLTIPGARPSPVKRRFGEHVSPAVILPLAVLLKARGH